MTIGLLDTIRDSRLTQITTAIDAGAGAGTLKIYDGARPAKAGAVTNLLATLTFSDPCESTITGGVLTFDSIADDTSADQDGTATWARVEDSVATFVMDMSVGTSGEDINLNSVAITTGSTVSITSATITDGNA